MPEQDSKTDLLDVVQIMSLRRTYTHVQATRACASRRPAGTRGPMNAADEQLWRRCACAGRFGIDMGHRLDIEWVALC